MLILLAYENAKFITKIPNRFSRYFNIQNEDSLLCVIACKRVGKDTYSEGIDLTEFVKGIFFTGIYRRVLSCLLCI